MSYKMLLNRQKFLKTEFGSEMENVIRVWDQTLSERRKSGDNAKVLGTLAWCQAQWEVYKLAMKQFYGIEYFFTRTDEYFGICTEDEGDWLMKEYRESVQNSQYDPTKEDVKVAMRLVREMEAQSVSAKSPMSMPCSRRTS